MNPADAPAGFTALDYKGAEFAGWKYAIQVAPDDCTGCGVCVDVCPAKSKTDVSHKAINMEPYLEHRDEERVRWDAFTTIANGGVTRPPRLLASTIDANGVITMTPAKPLKMEVDEPEP